MTTKKLDKALDKNEKFWDRVAKSEAKHLDKFGEDYQQTLSVLEQYLNTDLDVLDFACGSGKVSLAIADKVNHLTGIDISSGMIGVVQAKAEQQGINNVEFLHGTIDDPRLEVESFDLVVACNILHLLDKPQVEIKKIASLIKPGGLFIASTGVLGEKRSIATSLLWLLSKIKILPKMHFYKAEQLRSMISEEFTLVDDSQFTGTFIDLFIVAKRD